MSEQNGRGKKQMTAPVVFISCGQFTPQEKQLGKQVCEIVCRFGYEPYFAENQKSLKGFNENILSKLNECVGLIAIMHPRGTVRFSAKGKKHVRGSVWIEQEIAIAAFMAQCLNREIEVEAFIHEAVKREGLREFLQLNPLSFVDDQQVLDQLPDTLKRWRVFSSQADAVVIVSYRPVRQSSEEHEYQLEVRLQNKGDSRVSKYQVELDFPSLLLSDNSFNRLEVRELSTPGRKMFRVTELNFTDALLLPGDNKRMFTLDYHMNRRFHDDVRTMSGTFTVRLRAENQAPQETTFNIFDFQNF